MIMIFRIRIFYYIKASLYLVRLEGSWELEGKTVPWTHFECNEINQNEKSSPGFFLFSLMSETNFKKFFFVVNFSFSLFLRIECHGPRCTTQTSSWQPKDSSESFFLSSSSSPFRQFFSKSIYCWFSVPSTTETGIEAAAAVRQQEELTVFLCVSNAFLMVSSLEILSWVVSAKKKE